MSAAPTLPRFQEAVTLPPRFAQPSRGPHLGRGVYGVPAAELLLSMVDGLEELSETECWPSPGNTRTVDGYAQVRYTGRPARAHRIALAWSMGLPHPDELPEDLVVDHICRVRECVNPRHLRLITHRENTLIGVGPVADHARRTHCPRGHSLTGENLRPLANGWRGCLRCFLTRKAARLHVIRNTIGLPRPIRAYIVDAAVETVGTLPEPPSGSWSTEGTEAARRIVAECFPDYMKR